MPKPRTKRANMVYIKNMDPNIKAERIEQVEAKLNELREQYEADVEDIRMCANNMIEEIKKFVQIEEQLFTEEMLHTKLGDPFIDPTHKSIYENSILHALSSTKKLNSILEPSFSAKKSKNLTDSIRKPLSTRNQKSDEGYLTAESTRSRSTDRNYQHQQSTLKTALKNKRKSRSLSRSKMPKSVQISVPYDSDQENKNEDEKTPEKRMPPPNSYYITPKVKKDIPVTVLRRPQAGEMALSMQGSPLLVSGFNVEEKPNVNIPLDDGKIISLKPGRGIRISQIPEISKSTREQLELLRDHLNIVCSIVKDRDE